MRGSPPESARAPSSFEAVVFALLATLLALAIVEHLLLMARLPAEAPWRWWLKPRRVPAAGALTQNVNAADIGPSTSGRAP